MPSKPSRFYKLIYIFEESFPRRGAKVLDKLIFTLAGNRLVYWLVITINASRLKRKKHLERFCVLVDVNIGDAVIAEGVAESIKRIFPESKIDYVVKKSAGGIVPEGGSISKVYAVYTNAPFPSKSDVEAVNKILSGGKYDVVFNFCPFIKKQELSLPERTVVIGYFGLASSVVMAEKNSKSVSHIAYQMSKFVFDLFSGKPSFFEFKGPTVSISDESIEEARRFLDHSGLDTGKQIVFLNPETSSRFTTIPFEMQLSIVKGIVALDCNLIISSSHTRDNIQERLFESLPENYKKRVKIVPSGMSLSAYSALIDYSDVFITGDTGPLHIASAMKISKSGSFNFRNKTSVFSVFGATPGRIYGYASETPGFISANQNASSRVYESGSHLKSMVNINKGKIFCEDERKFFEGLDVLKLVEDVKMRLLTKD